MRNRHILILLGIVAAMAAVAVVVSAGDPDNPPGPPETTDSYTVEDIYNRLDAGVAGMPSAFTEPSSGPPTSTMHTLNEIMSVAPQMDDTNGATQGNVLADRIVWGLTSGGWGVMTGTMPDNGAVTIVPTTTAQTIAVGYHNGSGYAEGDADLIASNIVSGANIFGVDGTFAGDSTYNAGVPQTGQTKCYDASGTEIACTGTGQDGELQKGVAWITSTRFITGTTGVVTDTLTGLVWLENANCAGGTVTWTVALSYSNALYDGCTDCFGTSGDCGLSDGSSAGDWRLPNVRELQSLIDYGEHFPSLPDGYSFTNVQLGGYWSGTAYAYLTDHAWLVYLNDGRVYRNNEMGTYSVWPVRGGK